MENEVCCLWSCFRELCQIQHQPHPASSALPREFSQSAGLVVDSCPYPVAPSIQSIQESKGNPESHQLGRAGGGSLVHPEKPEGLAASAKVVDGDDQVTLKKKKSDSVDSAQIFTAEEDTCPICLEEYDAENPRMITSCQHCFHLSCILEWMERSDRCPICDKMMVFTQSS